jgi:adenine C2-methylase RlmN of 23S rRNA A2503 and tRNA A37
MGAKHHVLADTTTAYEIAAVEGRRMYVPLDVPHIESQPFLDNNMAIGVRDAKQLLQEIQNTENQKDIEYNTRSEQVWRKNAKHNVESFFSQMSEQGWPYPENFVYRETE